jgi:GYF domain 2
MSDPKAEGEASASTPKPAAPKALKQAEASAPPESGEFKGRSPLSTLDDSELFLLTYVRRTTRKNAWYYRDRCGVARGPAPIPIMRDAWVNGIIDQNTLVWGSGLMDFLPIKNVRSLTGQIRTPEGVFLTVPAVASRRQSVACSSFSLKYDLDVLCVLVAA